MKGLTICYLLVLLLVSNLQAKNRYSFQRDSLKSAFILMLTKPDPATKYAYGIDELLKAADLYRAVEEASVYKALADEYSEKLANKSAENYLKALTKLKNFKISKQYGDLSYRLSMVYLNQKKYDSAVKYLMKSITAYDSLSLKPAAGKSYIQLASIKLIQKKYKEAETLILKKGLPLCAPSDNLSCYQILSYTYHNQNRFSEAKWFYLQANTLSRKLNDTSAIITSLIGLAKVKTSLKEYIQAINDLYEAETLTAQNPDFSAFLNEIKLAKQNIQTKAPKLIASKITLANKADQTTIQSNPSALSAEQLDNK